MAGYTLQVQIFGFGHLYMPLRPPVLADGRIYFLSEEGASIVIAPGTVFRKLAASSLDGGILASMAVSGGSIFIRTDSFLYRIAS